MPAMKLQKSNYKFRKVCSLEHLYILWPVGTDELWPIYVRVHSRVPSPVSTCTYFTFQNEYFEPHTVPRQLTNIRIAQHCKI
jgi:hypothetical protein